MILYLKSACLTLRIVHSRRRGGFRCGCVQFRTADAALGGVTGGLGTCGLVLPGCRGGSLVLGRAPSAGWALRGWAPIGFAGSRADTLRRWSGWLSARPGTAFAAPDRLTCRRFVVPPLAGDHTGNVALVLVLGGVPQLAANLLGGVPPFASWHLEPLLRNTRLFSPGALRNGKKWLRLRVVSVPLPPQNSGPLGKRGSIAKMWLPPRVKVGSGIENHSQQATSTQVAKKVVLSSWQPVGDATGVERQRDVTRVVTNQGWDLEAAEGQLAANWGTPPRKPPA